MSRSQENEFSFYLMHYICPHCQSNDTTTNNEHYMTCHNCGETVYNDHDER